MSRLERKRQEELIRTVSAEKSKMGRYFSGGGKHWTWQRQPGPGSSPMTLEPEAACRSSRRWCNSGHIRVEGSEKEESLQRGGDGPSPFVWKGTVRAVRIYLIMEQGLAEPVRARGAVSCSVARTPGLYLQ